MHPLESWIGRPSLKNPRFVIVGLIVLVGILGFIAALLLPHVRPDAGLSPAQKQALLQGLSAQASSTLAKGDKKAILEHLSPAR